MSILRKRISAILLSLAMVTAVALPTFADDTQSYTPMQISAESEAFPQAYIEIENGTTLMARDGTTHLSGASVTVYYEEHYKYDSQGNLFITDSRLLSEDEVNAIGKENFDEGAPSLTREVSNTRGKLTIRMDGSYSTSGNSLTAFFSAMGNWSGTGSDPSACPSSGADVAGFHWGGNISTGETTARGEYGDNSSATVTLAGGTSNEAIAWYVTEKEAFKYIKNVFFNLNMSKSSLTGNGNTTELYFTYIHTYQSYNVTGSISASGAGISISNVANQWPLSVRLYGIPY